MKIKQLLEAPYLNDDDLGYQVLAKISPAQLNRAYTYFGTTKRGVAIYKKDSGGFIAGYIHGGGLHQVISISSRKTAYPLQPPGLEDYIQISMVNVSSEFAEEGHAKEVYTQIAKALPIVSDHEQYLTAKGLWKSLAKTQEINVYVCRNGEYAKYTGENILDAEIWGDRVEHRTVLLVATSKTL